MELNKKNTKKILLVVAFGVLLHWGVQNFRQVLALLGLLLGLLLPFLVGGCIAFVLNILLTKVERWLFSPRLKNKLPPSVRRPIGLIATLALVVAIITIIFFLIVPELGRSIAVLKATIPSFVVRLQEISEQLAQRWPEIAGWLTMIELDWGKLTQNLWGFLQNGAGNLINSTIAIAASLFSGVVTMLLGVVFALYILAQKESLGAEATEILYAFLPAHRARRIMEVAALTNRTFASFVSGQLTESVILGLMFFVSMSILKFPFAMMISVLVGVTALIPIFGAFIGCAVGVFAILVQEPSKTLWFILLFLVLQQLEGNFIYPKVVGNSVGLPSIWVLVAVTVGGSAMGIVGMLIFIPLCSVLYALLRQSVSTRLRAKGIEPHHSPEKKPVEEVREQVDPPVDG